MPTSPPDRRIPCAVCGALFPIPNDAFPFCSRRCRAVDLGNWLDERYSLGDEGEPARSDVGED